MHRILYLLLLCAAGSLSAQQMPERSLVRKGNRLYDKGRYDEAIGRYERALQVAAGLFEATYDLGNALYKAERYDRAEQTLQQAAADTLRTDTERAEAFYNLGNARFRQQKYREALESYRQSLRLNPSDLEAKYNYAYTKHLLDQEQNGGGNDDSNQDQNQDPNQDQNQDRNGSGNDSRDPDRGDGKNDPQQGDPQQNDPQQGGGQPDDPAQDDPRQQGPVPTPSGISPQEQEQMLDAIQAQEDKTQEKLKERQGTVVRGTKNW